MPLAQSSKIVWMATFVATPRMPLISRPGGAVGIIISMLWQIFLCGLRLRLGGVSFLDYHPNLTPSRGPILIIFLVRFPIKYQLVRC